MWSGMEASSRSEALMHCLSFRGHTGSFVSPFLGVGVEVKQGGGCTYALGTAEVSLQPASIAPLCAFEMGIYGCGGSSVEGHSPVTHRALGSTPNTAKTKERKKVIGSFLEGECNPGGERWAQFCFAVSTLAGRFELCTVQSYSWLSSWNEGFGISSSVSFIR